MHSTACTFRKWMTFAALVAAPAFAMPPLYATPPYATTGQRQERACSSSAFTLEVPLWSAGLPAGFEAAFTSRLTLDPSWFGCPTCPRSFYRVQLTPVLADYSSVPLHPAVPALRRDGHRRGYVVGFQYLTGFPTAPKWIPVAVVESQGCQAVSAVRAAGAGALGVTISSGFSVQPPLLVSRSCDVLVQDSEGWLPVSAVQWAQARIGATPMPGLPKVDVALVDTGVPKTYRFGLGVVDEVGLPSFEPWSATFHPHGVHMAALIHAVAPHAEIRSYRALGGNGMGSLSSLARATDDAIFDNGWTVGGRRPLVVNLSVGAPPDFFNPSELKDASCTTWEDGGGELMRYVLFVAGQVEQQSGKAVFIAAASGNSLLEKSTTSQTPWVRGPARTPCGGLPAGPFEAPSSFLLAGFGERPSCPSVDGGTAWLPVLPVGASTFDDQSSQLTQRGSAPKLYAPGERVFASSSTLPPADRSITCTSFADLTRFESPASVSGTSASTAFVSAAAAHLLTRPMIGGWRSTDLARLLFLTGEPLCERGVRLAGRRLSIKRAEQAISSGSVGCSALRACLRDPAFSRGPLLSSSTGTVCAAAMSACFASTAVLACAPPAIEPGWAAGYLESIPTAPSECRRTWGARSELLPTRGLTGSNAAFTDVQLAGMGPQPAGSGCPNCSVILGPDSLWLQFELSDALLEDTRILDGYLVFLDEEKNPMAWARVSDRREWRPGEVGRIEVTAFGELAFGELALDPTRLSSASRRGNGARCSMSPWKSEAERAGW